VPLYVTKKKKKGGNSRRSCPKLEEKQGKTIGNRKKGVTKKRESSTVKSRGSIMPLRLYGFGGTSGPRREYKTLQLGLVPSTNEPACAIVETAPGGRAIVGKSGW